MDSNNLFCLKWSNFQKNVSNEFKKIQMDEDLVDITFVCGEGESFGAHKLVLFACSPFLKRLLKVNPCSHPIFYMNGVKQEVLKAILDYMYLGEVKINQEDLPDFLRVAEEFKIRGVTPDSNTSKHQASSTDNSSESNTSPRTNKRPRSAMSSSQQAKSGDQRPEPIFYDSAPQASSDIVLKTESEMSEFHDDSAALSAHESNTMQYSESMRNNSSLPIDDGFDGNSENNSTAIENCNESWIDDDKQHSFSSNSNNAETDKTFKSKSNSGKAQCLVPSSCPSCHRVYSNISNLRQHIRLIHNPMSVNCPICNKTFNSNLYLKRHYLSMHNSSPNNINVPAGTDLKNDNVTPSPVTAIPTPSMNYNNQDLYAKRVNVSGSIHESLSATNNATSSVTQQQQLDLKMNSTWNPYSDLNHAM
ncbi:broad-complex core protein isoforms 1/2/3/4/5-like [Bradysia coprophila]|uniref:broad-complex core protein isoforms 1/2/3/4/5-like n=1 Tax=Bradysia coprophila TaxID=38358 RepID=UPI00187DABFD|nr:broad-complex core protein isoforms 1/2/3/4/5-like [Bradysia coprophila]